MSEDFIDYKETLLYEIKEQFGLGPQDLDLDDARVYDFYLSQWTILDVIDFYQEKYDLTPINL